MQRIEGGILLPDGPGERPMRCDCCVIPRQMERRMNGPNSVIFYCPSSTKAYVAKRKDANAPYVLAPMPGFFSGGDTPGHSRRIYGRRDELAIAT